MAQLQGMGTWGGSGAGDDTPPFGRTMRAAHVGIRVDAFSCLLAVGFAVAMQASGAAADDFQAGPALVRNTDAARPRLNQRHLLSNQRHLRSFDSRRLVHEGTALRAIATKDTLATDQAMAATSTTCDKCQWQ